MSEQRITSVAGMKPWLCEYTGDDDHQYCITLYGTDAKQVLRDNENDLRNLKILSNGDDMYVIPVEDEDDDA